MIGVDELAIDAPPVAHQKPRVIGPQHRGGLLESPPLLNAVHRDLRRAEGPHPPQPPAHFPSRLIWGHAGRAANLVHQRLIGGLRLVGHPRHRLAQSAAAHPQSERLLQQPPPSCRRAAPILYSSAWPERWPAVPAAKPHRPPRPRSAADAALAPAHHRPGNVPHECETRSAPPAARESRSGIATPPRFPALRLRSVDNARAAVLPPPRQSSGESAAGTGVRSLFRAFARAGRDGLWGVGGRRGRLGAWRHATLLPTAAADARSPLSALRSR